MFAKGERSFRQKPEVIASAARTVKAPGQAPLQLMADYPSQQIVKSVLTCCRPKDRFGQIVLRILELYPVQLKKNEHGVSADALVPVHKGMVFDQAEPETGRFLLDGRKVFSAQTAKSGAERKTASQTLRDKGSSKNTLR